MENVCISDASGDKLETYKNAVVITNGQLPSGEGLDIPVEIQDQSTPPVDVLFSQEVDDFTLASNTGESGKDINELIFTFDVVAGHTLVIGSEILLLDPIGDRQFQAEVIDVDVNEITVDRPIDHDFPVTSLAKKINTDMSIDGSSTAVKFVVGGGVVPIDYTRIILTIVDDGSMDDSKFGGINALAKGVVFRIVNSYQKTIFNWKTNGDIKQFAFDGTYQDGVIGPTGENSFSSRITFNGQDKHGVVLRIGTGDELQIIIQDDLSALSSFKISAMGHKTSGEQESS